MVSMQCRSRNRHFLAGESDEKPLASRFLTLSYINRLNRAQHLVARRNWPDFIYRRDLAARHAARSDMMATLSRRHWPLSGDASSMCRRAGIDFAYFVKRRDDRECTAEML